MEACPLMLPHDGISTGWKFVGSRPRLFAAGRETQGAIARRLGVSRQSVMRWYRAWRAGGRGGLRAARRAGRKPRPAPGQVARVDTALREGPPPPGVSTPLWTLPRVPLVIKRVARAN